MAKKSKKKRKATKKKIREPYTIDKGVSPSLLSMYIRCREECRMYLEGWKLPRPNTARDWGSLMHEAERYVYAKCESGKPTAALIKKAIASGEKEIREEAGCLGPEALQDIELMLTWAEVILPRYCDYWAEHGDDFTGGAWYDLESKFEVLWEGFKLKGRRDGLRWIKSKRGKKGLWLQETKHKGRVEEGTILDTLEFDFQTQFYIHATDLILAPEGLELSGMVFNIIRRPNQKWNSATKSLKEFGEYVAADVDKRPEHYFIRYECTYTKAQKERFAEHLKHKLEEFDAWLHGYLKTFPNEYCCTAGRRCDFIQACASGTMAGYIQKQRRKR